MDEEKKEEFEINIESEEDVEDLEELAEEIAATEDEEERTGAGDLEARVGELDQKYVRLYADFENYRKRVAKEKEELMKFAPEPLVFDLLTVIDTLELALTHANEDESSGSLKKGIEMTLKEFFRVLERSGLKQVEAMGKPFDPTYHEAMTQVIHDDLDEGIVVEELRKGYLMYDKLLRPALVAVSKAAREDSDNGEDEQASN